MILPFRLSDCWPEPVPFRMPFYLRGAAGLLVLLILPVAVPAQTTAPAAPTVPPPPSCVAPKIVERATVASEDLIHLQQSAEDYRRCMKAYIDARQAAADAASAQAKAEVDAGNAAAHQVNDLYAAVKAYTAKHAKD